MTSNGPGTPGVPSRPGQPQPGNSQPGQPPALARDHQAEAVETARLAALGAFSEWLAGSGRAALGAFRNAMSHRGALDAAWEEYEKMRRGE